MLINELAKRSGITAHTIRFYEKSGLIKGKRDENVKSNNYFHYNDEDLERLEAIVAAKSAGFTISEIATFIDACFAGNFTSAEALDFLDKKSAELDEKMKDLKAMKKTLERFKKEVMEG
jgi:MerR family transcriptional regulator, copper efflux regulator